MHNLSCDSICKKGAIHSIRNNIILKYLMLGISRVHVTTIHSLVGNSVDVLLDG